MNLLLLSTCGTSLLTNTGGPEAKGWLNAHANAKTLSPPELQTLQKFLDQARAQLDQASSQERRKLSAELNSIGAVLERYPSARVRHVLLHSETALGKAVAELLETYLPGDMKLRQLLTVQGLRTSNLDEFGDALSALTGEIDALCKSRDHGGRVIFNLTGGFKSLNAYIQALGMLWADQCVFLFEGATELMTIPRLPIQLADTEEVRRHLSVFRRLELGYPVTVSEVSDVAPAMLVTLDTDVAWSFLGKVAWDRSKADLYREHLLPPLSSKLTVEGLGKTFQDLPANRKQQLNETIDALSAWHDRLSAPLKSHSAKELKGNPAPPSTHEMYAWSDGDAARLLFHIENGFVVVDQLRSHL